MKWCSAFIAIAMLCNPATAFAGAVITGFSTTPLNRGDDFFVGPIDIGFSANFFGTTYGQTFLSNNGYLTFGSGASAFTPVGLGSAYTGVPIIAAFFADVDTTGAGSGVAAYGLGTFDGRNAFGATWDGVGYFGSKADKLNTFQILLVDRADSGAGNFDILLNYDQIQWESGDVESLTNDGLGGNTASVGYNAGQAGAPGTYFEFAGSQTSGAFLDDGPLSLAANGNTGIAGRYLFNVRNGAVTPPPAVPEPASWAMMLGGVGLMGYAMRRRPKVTTTNKFA